MSDLAEEFSRVADNIASSEYRARVCPKLSLADAIEEAIKGAFDRGLETAEGVALSVRNETSARATLARERCGLIAARIATERLCDPL